MKDEVLCTFSDSARHKNYHIVHAVKKNVQDIKRADFKGEEQREDAYGTSVISIQMLKQGGFISIKNRYNHAVAGCDNTFNSNPDNIIQGLSAALKDKFKVDFSASKNPLPDGYVVIYGRIVKYHTELNNIYYGDGFWVKNGFVNEVNRAAGDVMFDYFIFENKTKTLKKIDPNLRDSFADDFNRDYGGNKGLYIKGGNLMLGDDVLIGAAQSRIKTLFLPALQRMGANCLTSAHNLKQFSADALQSMGNYCLNNAPALTQFSADALQSMDTSCLYNAPALIEFSAPALKTMDYWCLQNSMALQKCDIGALQSVPEHLKRFAPPQSTHPKARAQKSQLYIL